MSKKFDCFHQIFTREAHSFGSLSLNFCLVFKIGIMETILNFVEGVSLVGSGLLVVWGLGRECKKGLENKTRFGKLAGDKNWLKRLVYTFENTKSCSGDVYRPLLRFFVTIAMKLQKVRRELTSPGCVDILFVSFN